MALMANYHTSNPFDIFFMARPEKSPFKEQDFFRADQNDDGIFYRVPRLVYHIDEPAVASLTQYYRKTIPKGSDILDICSSWVS